MKRGNLWYQATAVLWMNLCVLAIRTIIPGGAAVPRWYRGTTRVRGHKTGWSFRVVNKIVRKNF